jgi:hypothetical protein
LAGSFFVGLSVGWLGFLDFLQNPGNKLGERNFNGLEVFIVNKKPPAYQLGANVISTGNVPKIEKGSTVLCANFDFGGH